MKNKLKFSFHIKHSRKIIRISGQTGIKQANFHSNFTTVVKKYEKFQRKCGNCNISEKANVIAFIMSADLEINQPKEYIIFVVNSDAIGHVVNTK